MHAPRAVAVLSLIAALSAAAVLRAGAAPRRHVARTPMAGHARTAAPAMASPDSAPPRLGHDAVPTAESVELELDPERADYRGRATVALDVRASIRELRFHARALTVDTVTVHGATGDAAIAAVDRLAPDQVRVRFARPIDPGAWTLALAFHNAYDTRAVALYKVTTRGASYLFTQLEDTEAREAFPCWDEPEFKIPWAVTLTVPLGDLAVGNAPIARERQEGAMKRVEFARTRPLPSYLVAIAVGPFDTVPIRGLTVPGRLICVRGAAGLAAEATRLAPPILRSLERYFGRPYPYEKLDLIAAPEFLYGAMENAGAIVFADRLLLADPHSMGPDDRRSMASVMAHEMAHMWFGDLVTMRWWDDLWLNESFASWMATKVMDDVAPEYRSGMRELYGTERALVIDSRLSTRAMRSRITGATTLGQTASALTYNKGEAVLTMFEGWLGRERFRTGVVHYLKEHEWSNAEGADLWRALAAVSGEDIPDAMASFLDRPGVPLVTVEPLGGGRVRLSQRRFVTLGDAPDGQPPWRIPVLLRYPFGATLHTQRAWLTRPDTVIALEGGAEPKWIEPNAGASGYYRWSVPESMRDALVAARGRLTARERIDLATNLTAHLRVGSLDGGRYLAAMAELAADPSPEVVRVAVDALVTTRPALVAPSASAAYAHWLRAALEPAVTRFRTEPAEGESVGVALLRPHLLRLLAIGADDARVLRTLREASAAHRARPGSVPASMIESAILLGALTGDRAQFEDYRRRFETTPIPNERALYLAGLGSFRDPALRLEALRYALEGPLRPQEPLVIPAQMALNAPEPDTRSGEPMYPDDVRTWMFEHWEALAAKLPPNFATRIMSLAGGCGDDEVAQMRAFFVDPRHRVMGGDASLARLAEACEECARVHARASARVTEWLMSRAAGP